MGRNVLGLAVHPYRTLKRIKREQDISQFFLLLGLPFYGLVGGVVGVLVLRWLTGRRGELGWLAKDSLLAMVLGFGLAVGYLGYWWWRVWRER